MVTEVTEVHVFDYGTGSNVWTLFFAPAGTYRDDTFEPLSCGGELMRFCASFMTHEQAERLVRATLLFSGELRERVTVFRHKL